MKKIAIVEDNADNRMLVCALLEDDYELVEYEDGTSALNGLLDEAPDLILLDISLPGLDGCAVLNALKETSLKNVPVVALTAHAMEGDREMFIQQGFDAYVSKPIVDENKLFDVINNLLRG